jgi:hypothetical protein
LPPAKESLNAPPDTGTRPASPRRTAVASPTQGIETVPVLETLFLDPANT